MKLVLTIFLGVAIAYLVCAMLFATSMPPGSNTSAGAILGIGIFIVPIVGLPLAFFAWLWDSEKHREEWCGCADCRAWRRRNNRMIKSDFPPPDRPLP